MSVNRVGQRAERDDTDEGEACGQRDRHPVPGMVVEARAAVTWITDRCPVTIYKDVDGTRDALISRGQCIDP